MMSFLPMTNEIDFFQHTFELVVNLIIPEPQHSITERLQEGVALLIIIFLAQMSFAIKLNNHLAACTNKIDDVRPNRLLTPKLEIIKSATSKVLPQNDFSRRSFCSQPPCLRSLSKRITRHKEHITLWIFHLECVQRNNECQMVFVWFPLPPGERVRVRGS
jgi:hypothetical protein